jgi:hypothetical protein
LSGMLSAGPSAKADDDRRRTTGRKYGFMNEGFKLQSSNFKVQT